MRMRGMIVAVVLLAALAGAVWWSNQSEAEKAALPLGGVPPTILKVPENRIVKLELRKGGESIVVEKKNDAWELTSPRAYPADRDMLTQYLPLVATITADRVIDEKAANIAQYGLTKPTLELLVTTSDGKTQHVVVGDPTPSGGASYTALQGASRVFTISSAARASLDRSSAEFRDKRLLTVDDANATRLELTAKGQTVELTRDPRDEWQIVKPSPMRADGAKVDEVLRRLGEARLDTSASDEDLAKNTAAFNAGVPFAAARVSDRNATQQLQVRRAKDQNLYVKSDAVAGVYRAATVLVEALDKTAADLRNRKLFDFGWAEAVRIDVRDGARQTSYDRSTGKWSSAGRPLDSASMEKAIGKLRDLTAASFPEKGFAEPTFEVTVVWNGGKSTERAAFCKAGNDWIAQRSNEPSLYQVDAKAMAELVQAFADVKPAAPAKKK